MYSKKHSVIFPEDGSISFLDPDEGSMIVLGHSGNGAPCNEHRGKVEMHTAGNVNQSI